MCAEWMLANLYKKNFEKDDIKKKIMKNGKAMISYEIRKGEDKFVD